MILDSTTKSLELILGSAVTTTAMPINVDYVDMTTTTTIGGSSDSQSNGVTLVTILAAPAASTQRKVNAISVYNADSVSKVVTVRLNNNTTLRTLVVLTLQVGETLGYSDIIGWYVQDTNGNRKSTGGSSDVAAAIAAAPNKVTPIGADKIGIWDSVSGLLNGVLFSNLNLLWANIAGSASQVFSVAPATAAGHAVRADQLGSYLESIVLITSTISLAVSGTTYNITSIALTAGTWLVGGSVSFVSGSVDSRHIASISSISATIGNNYEFADLSVPFPNSATHKMTCPNIKVTVSTTQTIYLVAYATYTGTAPTAYGKIYAFRQTAY